MFQICPYVLKYISLYIIITGNYEQSSYIIMHLLYIIVYNYTSFIYNYMYIKNCFPGNQRSCNKFSFYKLILCKKSLT
jgi:hypothetical protein